MTSIFSDLSAFKRINMRNDFWTGVYEEEGVPRSKGRTLDILVCSPLCHAPGGMSGAVRTGLALGFWVCLLISLLFFSFVSFWEMSLGGFRGLGISC